MGSSRGSASENEPVTEAVARPDLGWTHVALPARDLARSIAFYAQYAGMSVVHDRTDEPAANEAGRVVWLSDRTRPFVLVLLQTARAVERPLGPFAHLGIALASRADVDGVAARARAAGVLLGGPHDDGPPVGYWCFIADPDGHVIEFAYGQHVGLTVERARAV
jgi:catechol 2,3-dioxygenase-like lactoylglutathione lyase family enzyme